MSGAFVFTGAWQAAFLSICPEVTSRRENPAAAGPSQVRSVGFGASLWTAAKPQRPERSLAAGWIPRAETGLVACTYL